MADFTYIGVSGTRYSFFLADMNGDWMDVPVVYAFARKVNGFWGAFYIGQAVSARTRFQSHERWPEAVRRGATHVLNHSASPDEEVRKREERDLIAALNPPLNVQHRPVGKTILTGGFELGSLGLSGLGLINQSGRR